MEIGISWVPDDPRGYPDLVRRSEEVGASYLGVPDSQAGDYRECYVMATLAMTNTSWVSAGPLVSNPLTRHPAVAAAAIATVNEVSGGRAILSLATGDTGVLNLGMRPATLSRLEAYTQGVRELLRGEEVVYDGRQMRIRWASTDLPIYLAADGPRTMELAGRIADGVVVGFGITSEAVSQVKQHVARGAEAAGRDSSQVKVWFMVGNSIMDDGGTARRHVRAAVASSTSHSFRHGFEGKAVPERFKDGILRLQDEYQVGHHHAMRGRNPNADLIDESGPLGSYLMGRMAVAGTEEYCVERLQELEGSGVDGIMFRPMVEDRFDYLHRLGRVIEAV